MTLDQAITKADQQMDDICDRILCDAEEFIRGAGGTDDEVTSWLDRKRADLLGARRQIHESIRVAFWTGLDSPSVRVH